MTVSRMAGPQATKPGAATQWSKTSSPARAAGSPVKGIRPRLRMETWSANSRARLTYCSTTRSDTPSSAGRRGGDVVAVEPDGAGGGREQAAGHPEQGRLPRAVGPEEGEARRGRHGEVDVAQDGRLPVAGGDPGQFEHHATSSSVEPR